MEYRIKDYAIRAQMILLPRPTTIEDLRFIFNETQKKLICSTANKDLVTLRQQDGGTIVVVPSSVCTLNETDQLTIKCDYGDNLSSVEGKVDDGVAILSEVKDALAEVKTMVTPAFTISIKGKNGKYNISFAGIIEAEQEASSFMEGNTLHIPNATMQGSTLMLNARVEGNILYL